MTSDVVSAVHPTKAPTEVKGASVRISKPLQKLFRAVLVLIPGCAPGTADHAGLSQQDKVASPNQMLAALFQSHQIQAEISGEWIVFPGTANRAAAVVVDESNPVSAITVVQLDVRLELEDGRQLIESFAGAGDSKEKAIADAFNNFAVNSFHVLLRAFFVAEDDQVTVEKWVIDGKPRTVIIGNMGTRGALPQSGPSPNEWFPEFESNLKSMPLDFGTHWIRVYYAQMNYEPSELEVLIDNDPWLPLNESLTGINWPKAKEFFSVRVFMVISDK